MEQSEQIADIKSPVKRRRTKLPMKTKIAVWWILIIGVVGTTGVEIYIYHWLVKTGFIEEVGSGFVLVVIFIIAFLYITPGIFLTFKTKSSWITSVLFLSLELIAFSTYYALVLVLWSPLYSSIFFLYIVPLILIIADKKNYWIMLSHISAKAKRRASAITSGRDK